MTLPNPKFAPRRNDLPWLRRRRRPPRPVEAPVAKAAPVKAAPVTAAPPHPTTTPPAPSGQRIDYTRHDRTHAASPPAPTPPPRREQPAPAPSSDSSLDLSLDLSSPTPAPAPPPAPRPEPPITSGNPLDLSSPSPTPPAPPSSTSSTSLDLDAPASEPPVRAERRTAPPPPAPDRHHVVRRTRSKATTLLDFGAPVVTLDRLQSGIGELTLDAVVGDEVGDLRIGAAWALADGRTGTVELDADRRHGPEGRRPVVWAQKQGRFERIAIDLRQTRALQRLLVYGFSAGRQTVNWGGTVVVTTYGGDRIDVPIVSAPSPAVMALVSVYNVDGEFVLRSEMDPVSGSVRDTCRAFGYDRITWLDDRTPVV